MADKNFKIWASLEVDNKQIKSEFTKAWELAWESVAQWFDKQQGTILDKIKETTEYMKSNIESLQNIDFDVNLTTSEAERNIQQLDSEIQTVWYTVENLKYWWQEFGDEWKQAFDELKSTSEEYTNTLYATMDQLQYMWQNSETSFNDLKDSVDKTTEAVEELNKKAEEWMSENRWVWKLIKFLWSARVVNFFYNNLKKIWEKLIELSWDSERLASKREPIQAKLEAVWWYLWKALVPAVDNAIDEIDKMASELMKTGEDWSSVMQTLQKWLYRVWQAFNAVWKIVKSFWQYFWTQIANMTVLVSAFWQDFYETAKSVIQWIWNTSNWEALWNNIKYWIVQWVNGAIDSLNWLLSWIDNKLWINLGQVWKINAWSKQSYSFWDIDFSRTKNAINDINKANLDLMDEIWEEWWDFWNKAKQWYKDLWNTAIETNKKITEDTKKTLWGWWGGSSKDSVKWAYEELEEEAVSVWEELSSMVEDHQKSYDKLTEQIEKVREQYDKLRDEAKKTWEDAEKSLEEYNSKLETAQAEAITDLWQRYVELQKDLMWIDETIKREAEELSRWYIRRLQQSWVAEYEWFELKKLIDIKEKLEELQLIEENTTEEQRKQDEFLKETSKAQEIINKLKEQETELENKKAAAMEKQAIAQAMMAQEDWKQYIKTVEWKGTRYYDEATKKWEEIHDLDNIEYAKQLESQSMNLNDQLKQFQQEKDTEVEILIDTTARKIELENEFQKVFEENIKKQWEQIEGLIQKEQRLIDKRREYLSMWGTLHNAYGWSVMSWQASVVWENWPETIIARQSSYVQPRNAGNSYNTVNNSNSLSINGIEIGNFNTIDDMLDALKERLTYRS